MNHTRLLVTATIIAAIIFIGFMLSVPHTHDAKQISLPPPPTPAPSVAIRDVFKKGVHTLTGSIEAPNACTSLATKATLAGSASSTQYILVAITMPEDSGVCLERSVKMPFSLTISAPANLPVQVSVNNTMATTTDL